MTVGVVHHEPIPTIHINYPDALQEPTNRKSISDSVKKMLSARNLLITGSQWLIYATVFVFLCLNTVALLNRMDTIYYLRIYQLIVACVMLVSSAVMIEFLIYANLYLIKLDKPHSMPRPMMVSSLLLTVGIVLGYAYFIVFNLTFQDCDVLVDALKPAEVWFDIIYEIAMIWFCSIAFFYLMQRSYYGNVRHHSDRMRRLWINATICIAWIQIVVYKGYLSHQGLCQRKELNAYWCIQRNYTCNIKEIGGTRQNWLHLNKGLLNSTIIACASEFFPVILVAHWLVCGGAEKRAKGLIEKIKKKKSIRRVLHHFMADISRIYGAARHSHVSLPPLRTTVFLRYFLCVNASISIFLVIAHWFIKFYYTILFDRLYKENWMIDEYAQFLMGIMQLLLNAGLYYWSTRIEKRRFDAHHKAEARGDIVIIIGCCILLTIKSILQLVELDFQTSDGFITTFESILKIIILVMTITTQWLQFLSLRRILALSDRDIYASRSFLPVVAVSLFIAACVNFAATFFETTLIKYQLAHEEEYGFSLVTLVSMIITQTIYPADYLFAFTVAGCWMDLIYRYSNMGVFQLGKPSIDQLEFDNQSIMSGATSLRRSVRVEPAQRQRTHRLSMPTITPTASVDQNYCRPVNEQYYIEVNEYF